MKIRNKKVRLLGMLLMCLLIMVGCSSKVEQPTIEENSQLKEQSEESDAVYTATLTVTSQTLLEHIDKLDVEKVDLVPEDGIIYPTQTVTFYEGESVFDVLQREMKENKIHMEFVNTPALNSVYIKGINNLYEFDAGPLSGWMYKVNDWFPNYGASRYILEEGDDIVWVYTCDLGRDVGAEVIEGDNK